MRTAQRLACVAVAAAASLAAPGGDAFAQGLRGLAGSYLEKAGVWTDGALDHAERNGYLQKRKLKSLMGNSSSAQGQSAGDIFTRNAMSTTSGATGGSGPVLKKYSAKLPKSLQ